MLKSPFASVEIGSLLEKVAIPVAVDPDATYRQIGIRSHGKGLFDKDPVTGEALGDKRVFWVEPDCFIVNIVFAWEMAVGRTSAKDIGKIASHRFPMYRPRDGRADLDFITYLFKTEYGRELLALASPGGAGRNKTLGQTEFLKLKVRIPPLAEQRRIAEILSTWDRAIDVAEDLATNAQHQKKSLMRSLLTAQKRLPGLCDAWTETTLERIATVTMGSSPPSTAYNENGDGLPLIQGNADIKNRASAPRTYTKQITQICSPGDILFSVRAPVGEVSRSRHKACIGRGIASVRPRSMVDTDFLYFLLLNAESDWAKISQGSTFQAVNSKDLKGFRFLAPPNPEERERIGRTIRAAQTVEELLEAQLAALHREKSALMQQLLTGRRRVNVLEEAA
jgi:type I restriction enzyme S subunit